MNRLYACRIVIQYENFYSAVFYLFLKHLINSGRIHSRIPVKNLYTYRLFVHDSESS